MIHARPRLRITGSGPPHQPRNDPQPCFLAILCRFPWLLPERVTLSGFCFSSCRISMLAGPFCHLGPSVYSYPFVTSLLHLPTVCVFIPFRNFSPASSAGVTPSESYVTFSLLLSVSQHQKVRKSVQSGQ